MREFGIDHVVVAARLTGGVIAVARGGLALLLLLVDCLAELHRDLRERVGLFLHRFGIAAVDRGLGVGDRSEEHTSELQSLMRNSYAVFCLKKKNTEMKSIQTMWSH